MIGATGAGKSSFGKALTEGEAPFRVSERATTGTTITTEFTCDISRKWTPWFWSTRPDPRRFYWHFVDTPGLGDVDGLGVDVEHMGEMIQSLKASEMPVNVLALVVPFSPPRFSQQVQHLLKVFNSVFNEPRTWDQVCFVVTHTPPKATKGQREAWTVTIGNDKSVRDHLIDLLHRLWKWEGEDPAVPVFFVDSSDPHGPSESEFERFISFACTQGSRRIDVSKMKLYDPRVMQQLPNTRTIKTERRRYLGQVCLGTRKVKCFSTQKQSIPKDIEIDRSADFLDMATLGIAWLFRNKRQKVRINVEETVIVEKEVDEPIYQGKVIVEMIEQEEQRMITFDYTANAITTDDLESAMPGRMVSPWERINERIIGGREEIVG
jgi:hypothetical protein